jgi:hypothetical protein
MKFPIPVYGGYVHFFTDLKEYDKAHKKANSEGVEEALGWTSEFRGKDGKHNVLIGVFDNSPQTLVHECIHASLIVFERVNIDPTAESGEPFCYFTDYLFGMLVKHLK